MFEIRLRRIDDFHAVGSMPDEEVLPLSLRECESQLVGSYLKITVYHHFGFVMKIYHDSKIPAIRFLR